MTWTPDDLVLLTQDELEEIFQNKCRLSDRAQALWVAAVAQQGEDVLRSEAFSEYWLRVIARHEELSDEAFARLLGFDWPESRRVMGEAAQRDLIPSHRLEEAVGFVKADRWASRQLAARLQLRELATVSSDEEQRAALVVLIGGRQLWPLLEALPLVSVESRRWLLAELNAGRVALSRSDRHELAKELAASLSSSSGPPP